MEWCSVHGFSCDGKHCSTGKCGRPTAPPEPSTGARPHPYHPFPRRSAPFPGVYPYGYGYPATSTSVYVLPVAEPAKGKSTEAPEWYLTATKALGDAMLPVTSADTDSFWLDRLIEALRRWEADLKIRSDVARPPKKLT